MWSNFRNSSHLSCGEILDVSTWQMWKNSRPLHFCHVWKSEMSPHDRFFSTGTCYKYQSLWVWTGLFVGNPGGRYREPPCPLADNCFNCFCSCFWYQNMYIVQSTSWFVGAMGNPLALWRITVSTVPSFLGQGRSKSFQHRNSNCGPSHILFSFFGHQKKIHWNQLLQLIF